MTINLSIRSHSIHIGGLNCTNAVMSVQGSDTKLDQKGLINFKGQMVLARPVGFESIDDRRNDRWAKGQPISIQISDSTGTLRPPPRGGTLFITDSQYNPKDKRLTIQMGDILELLRFKEPGGDASKICLGISSSKTLVINRLLKEAGIDAGMTGTVPGGLSAPTPRLLDGSYIDQAAEIAASEGYFLYVDSLGVVRCAAINTKPTTTSFVINTGAIADIQRIAGREPPSELRVKGRTTVVTQNGNSTETITEEFGPALVAGAGSTAEIIVKRTRKSERLDRSRYQRTVETQVEQPVGAVLSDDKKYKGRTDLITSDFTKEVYSYEANAPLKGTSASTRCQQGNQGRLKTIESETWQLRGICLREVCNSYPTKAAAPPKTDLIKAETKTVKYEYDLGRYTLGSGGGGEDDEENWKEPLGRGPRISTSIYRVLGGIVPSEFTYSRRKQTGDPTYLVEAERSIQFWKEPKLREWSATVDEWKSLALAAPNVASELRKRMPRSPSLAFMLANLTPTRSDETISNAGQAQPPGPDTFPPEYSTSERTITGKAKLPTNAASAYREKRQDISFNYVTGVGRNAVQAQVNRLATIWGAIFWGQYKSTGYTTDLADHWWNYQPMQRVDVVEEDARFAYLADGFAIAMADRRCVVSFDGLYLGETVVVVPGSSGGGGEGGGEDPPVEEVTVVLPPYKQQLVGELAEAETLQTTYRTYDLTPITRSGQFADAETVRDMSGVYKIHLADAETNASYATRRTARLVEAETLDNVYTIDWEQVTGSRWRNMTARQWRKIT